ncbi:MAG: CoA transferase [Burkholderiaceae bacterium]|nr:CoA transferase [Burkholderiaceae bacterium]
MNEKMGLPLVGVKVLELSQIMAGPTCGLMLADMGADVIKVEKFPGGDDARDYRKPGDMGIPPPFLMLNRGKRSLALDIRQPRGKEVLKRMVRHTDILTENFRVGTMERLGLGFDVLSKENPELVYCAISGYGRQGPLAQKGGFDLVLQAFSGLISVTGQPGKPAKTGNSVADINAGLLAAFGSLAAYIARLKTGRGQRVDTSLLQSSMQQMAWFAAAYFSKGVVAEPMGTAHPLIAPYQAFRTADGMLVLGGANHANWTRITQVLGHGEWLEDERFATSSSRVANREVLATLIERELAKDTTAAWLSRFDEAGVPAGPVNNVAQALEHEQSRAAGMVIDVALPGGGTTRSLGSAVHVGGTPHAATGPAPLLGQHTSEVLQQFGFQLDEISRLVEEGTVYQAAFDLDQQDGDTHES